MDDTDADELYSKIKVLNERLWDHRATRPAVEAWLTNFEADLQHAPSEQLHALYILSQFVYFADREVRELLKSLYRDYFRYPIIEQLRGAQNDTLDAAVLEAGFTAELLSTRFLGVGNPAESGTHLLYYFRQENRLSKKRFASFPELFDGPLNNPNVGLLDPNLARLVFIDDFCGTGSQAVMYSRNTVGLLRETARRSGRSLHISYLVLAACTEGLEHIRSNADFDVVDAVLPLDDTFKALSPESRHFASSPGNIDRQFARETAGKYGSQLAPNDPLGYKGSELLLGFHHNIPDNTLPIIWWDEDNPPWQPIFRRYRKLY